MSEVNGETINAIAALTRLGGQPFDAPQGGKAIVLPNGAVHHLPPLDPILTHIKQSVSMLDAESFIAYVNRFKEPGDKTTIFANPQSPKFEARIDYHEKGKADYSAHKVTYVPPWSEQWARWRAIDGKNQSQLEFAEFVEENMPDIVAPEGAVFLDLITGLHAKKKVNFQSGLRLQDGSNQLTYEEEIEAKGRGTMVLPSDFSIGMPIFFGSEGYRIGALLRYRIDDGKLSFIVKIKRRLFIEQTAFSDIGKIIGDATGLKVLNGTI